MHFYAFPYPLAASTMLLEMLLVSMFFVLEATAEKVDFRPFRYIDHADVMELSYDLLGHLCWISFLYL